MKLRVATYNIRLGIQQGLAAIADVLADEAPDVVALQEVGDNWTMGPPGDVTEQLADLLGKRVGARADRLTRPNAMHVAPLTTGDARYGHALISWLPMTANAYVPLPQRVDEPRAVMTTTIALPDESHATIISTHLSHIADRPPQGARLIELVTAAQHPTLLMGDLNATEDESFIRTLLELCDDADPLCRPTFPAFDPQRRIDYILARDGVVTDVVVGEDSSASDHLYVAATWQTTL